MAGGTGETRQLSAVQASSFVLATDTDQAGDNLALELARRLGPEKCRRASFALVSGQVSPPGPPICDAGIRPGYGRTLWCSRSAPRPGEPMPADADLPYGVHVLRLLKAHARTHVHTHRPAAGLCWWLAACPLRASSGRQQIPAARHSTCTCNSAGCSLHLPIAAHLDASHCPFHPRTNISGCRNLTWSCTPSLHLTLSLVLKAVGLPPCRLFTSMDVQADCKDANEMLLKHGPAKLREAISRARPMIT